MKRTFPWSKGEDDSSSDDDGDSSSVDSDAEENDAEKSSKDKSSRAESGKQKRKGIDFEALSKHGYKGGLSVLKVPPPKESDEQKDWTWSKGENARAKEKEETYQDRQKTRAALLEAEELVHARTQKEKNLSFSQKEKRKRDMGQASRGKNYVEEEKRLLRESGIYSGTDADKEVELINVPEVNGGVVVNEAKHGGDNDRRQNHSWSVVEQWRQHQQRHHHRKRHHDVRHRRLASRIEIHRRSRKRPCRFTPDYNSQTV
nr:UPF0690 protein C1orf52 homolog [Ipomoea batatas]